MVRLNDRLAGAAPDTGRAISSLPVGAARSAAPTIVVQRTKPALARVAVRWNNPVRREARFKLEPVLIVQSHFHADIYCTRIIAKPMIAMPIPQKQNRRGETDPQGFQE